MPKNIVLMGYRGSGKTSVSKMISKELGFPIISVDKEIIKRTGPINDFVSQNGWGKFREIESEIIKNIDAKDTVIDCGGGFVEMKNNIVSLKKNGIIIWLKADPKNIIERIKKTGQRPSLTGTKSFTDEVAEVLAKRLPIYEKSADFEVDTNNKPVEEVFKEIKEIIKSNMY
jgi:shikimate kinase